jgi:outer membrane protein assembly factor BamB
MQRSISQHVCWRILPFLALVTCTLGVGVSTTQGEDWPQFRGPHSDNKVTGFKVPATWPKDLTKKWSVPVGDGVSSPALVGDKVYTFTRQGGDEVTLCLNAATGEEIWKDKYAADDVKGAAAGRGADKFTGPRSSPAVGDGKVCTFGVGGVVSCLDAAKGTVVWRKETKAKPQFYTATSPLITGGKCIIYIGSGGKGGGKGELMAYDLASGEEKWKWSGDAPGYGSPVLAKIAGTEQVVIKTDAELIGVALADGKLLWKHALKQGGYQTATPVIDGDTVIIAGYAFTVTKTDDTFTAKQVWKEQAPATYNTPVLKDGVLYGLAGTGKGKGTSLYAQDAKTGKVLWEDGLACGECGSILDVGSVLIELSSDGKLHVFKPDKKEYSEVTKYTVADSGTWSMPIISGNRIYTKDREKLTLWTVE